MKLHVIDQILAMAMHPSYNCETAQVPVAVLILVTQSPGAHRYIVRKGVVKNMLEVCQLKQKMVSEQQSSQSQQGEKEDLMAINVLKYVTIIFLYHISPPPPPVYVFLYAHTHIII